ncbi:MAG: glycosyltransferase family 4 protein [Candidatus Coatesbacteria bacterium]|nr:glycosyltransferase family 4 protein [Candidatus Coatesbacteria bacterium]
MRLCVISHKKHWLLNDKPVSNGGFVLEIDYWATMFDRILLCVPLHSDERPREGVYGYRMPDIEIAPLSPFRAKIPRRFVWRFRKTYRFVANLLRFCKMLKAIRSCDAVCVRCPGPASLLGLLASILTKRKRCARYGANWFPQGKESITERRQKALLRSKWFKGPVFVQWYPDERITGVAVPMFGSTITEDDIENSREAAASRRLRPNPRLLFVGRLSREKNVDVILRGVEILRTSLRVDVSLEICGDGDQRKSLEAQANALGIALAVTFHGMVPRADMCEYYSNADFLILASETEGWPKVAIEAMLYGLPCVGTAVGSVPYIIGENSERGLLWHVGKAEEMAQKLSGIITDEDLYKTMSTNARNWVEGKTLEVYRDQVKSVLEESWNCKLGRELIP